MSGKENKFDKKKIIILFFIICAWVGYFISFNNYYKDAKDFITPDVKFDIGLIELFYYRGKETMSFLIVFFVLVCVNMLFVNYLRILSDGKWKNIYVLISMGVLIIPIFLSMFNILAVIYTVLVIVSITINYIVYIVGRNRYSYYDGEILFQQDDLSNEKEANQLMEKQLESSKRKMKTTVFEIIGEVIYNQDETYSVEISVEEK